MKMEMAMEMHGEVLRKGEKRERRRECVTDFIAHWIRIHFHKGKRKKEHRTCQPFRQPPQSSHSVCVRKQRRTFTQIQESHTHRRAHSDTDKPIQWKPKSKPQSPQRKSKLRAHTGQILCSDKFRCVCAHFVVICHFGNCNPSHFIEFYKHKGATRTHAQKQATYSNNNNTFCHNIFIFIILAAFRLSFFMFFAAKCLSFARLFYLIFK